MYVRIPCSIMSSLALSLSLSHSLTTIIIIITTSLMISISTTIGISINSYMSLLQLHFSLFRRNLHVVLAFSPVGDAFRTRVRKFPALVNCTVIDWFQPWPHEALFSVGMCALVRGGERELLRREREGEGRRKGRQGEGRPAL